MNKNIIVGLMIFLVIVGVGAYLVFSDLGIGQVEEVKGYVGGEKIPYLQDEAVQKILKNEYHLEVDYIKAGSIEMAREDVSGMDFIWPSSQIALEIFKDENASEMIGNQVVFNSPIVLYSWKSVADALTDEHIATHIEGIYYSVDMNRFANILKEQQSWQDIGVDLYGNVKIISTDPLKSNSGNMYLGLLLNTLNGGVATVGDLTALAPDVERIFDELGYMESSSGTLFDRYLVRGVGDSPIIVGYESQMIDFAINNPKKWASIKNEVAIIYPVPTVWSEHPIIALTDKGKALMDALQDEKIQEIAAYDYGFRTINYAQGEDLDALPDGIVLVDVIDKIIPMPKADVMTKMMSRLEY